MQNRRPPDLDSYSSDSADEADVEKRAVRGKHRTRSRARWKGRHSGHSRASSLPSSRTSSCGSADAMLHSFPKHNNPSHLPLLQIPSPALPRSYRLVQRIIRWTCLGLILIIALFILNLIRLSVTSSSYLEAYRRERGPLKPKWQQFELLQRYYGGLRSLGPDPSHHSDYAARPINGSALPIPAPAVAPISQPLTGLLASTAIKRGAVKCFLDVNETMAVPEVHQYQGSVAGFPEAAVGSAEILGISNSTCFDRYGRFGPYGYGYSMRRGGLGAGLDGERQGAEQTWSQQPMLDFANVKWAGAQTVCLERNKHRFAPISGESVANPLAQEPQEINPVASKRQESSSTDSASIVKALPRTAVIVRTWLGFEYTTEVLLHLRALVSELALASGGEYTIHFLIHVRDDNRPIWADRRSYEETLAEALPSEFARMGTLWSERQMGLVYGGLAESFFEKLPVHGVYRSVFMALQHFAQNHDEFDYFWNMEMDVRSTGHWFDQLEAIRTWSRSQSRKGLWERNERFYIPAVHGSWEDFEHVARVQSEMSVVSSSNKWTQAGPPDEPAHTLAEEMSVWGPRAPPDAPAFPSDPTPPDVMSKDARHWGIDEEADLITLNPIFDPKGTHWRLAADVTGYNTTTSSVPRRASIVTTSRLSRRLLQAMHDETAHRRHSMFSEAWPASVALHHGLKAVYVPHPVYIDRRWPAAYLGRVLNAGHHGASGGSHGSVFGTDQEHNLQGVSWYYHSEFPPRLWRRWWGLRVDEQGGEVEELAHEGRMCLPPMLLHPIKDIHLPVEGVHVSEDTDI